MNELLNIETVNKYLIKNNSSLNEQKILKSIANYINNINRLLRGIEVINKNNNFKYKESMKNNLNSEINWLKEVLDNYKLGKNNIIRLTNMFKYVTNRII